MEACIDYFLNLHKGVAMTKGEKLYATYCFAKDNNKGANLVCKMYGKYEKYMFENYESLGISKGLDRNIIFEDLARYFYIILYDNVRAYPRVSCQLRKLKSATDEQMKRFKKTIITFLQVIQNAEKIDKTSFKRPRAMLAIFFAYCVKHIKFKHQQNDTSFQALINATKNLQDEKWTSLMKDKSHQNNPRWMDETYQYVVKLLSTIQTTQESTASSDSASSSPVVAAAASPTIAPIFIKRKREKENQTSSVSKKQKIV
jgi:hypothetical protein